MISLHNQFDLGQIVYLKTDTYQYPRIIVNIIVNPDISLLYKVCCAEETSTHYECELREDKDIVLATTN